MLTCPTNSVTIDATTNRLSGSPYTYDANGNMTNDGTNTLTYDAENHLLTSTGSGSGTYTGVYPERSRRDAENHLLTSTGSGSGTYTYDGNGVRVKKVSGSTTTVYVFSGSKVLAEYVNGAAVGSPTREYIYSGSQMIAKIEGGVTNYYHSDHLSARLTTDSTGALAGQQGHFPFGESWYSANTTTKFQFTSYERDAESGNDYAMARFDISRLGRFSSPDPMSGSLGNPQSLNRYAYVQNDPINLIDPLGQFSIFIPLNVSRYLEWCGATTAGLCVVTDPSQPQRQGAGDDLGLNWQDASIFAPQLHPTPTLNWWGRAKLAVKKAANTVVDAANAVKDAVKTDICAATQPLQQAATSNQGAVGAGAGGSFTFAAGLGISGTASVQIVADPQGNVGVAFTIGGDPGLSLTNLGISAFGGAQFSNSNAQNLSQLSGTGIDQGISVGPIGVDFSASGGGVHSKTLTVGGSVGPIPARGAALQGTITGIPSILTTNCGSGN